jgi:ferritin-like metal-binding protein YciE
MALETLEDLFEEQIKDLYNAENQLLKALPRMAKAASDEMLKEGFEAHTEETREHVERLKRVAELADFKPTGKKCAAMEGLIEEGKEVLEEDGSDAVIDVALVVAAQRVEHYEIAAYGNAVVLAQQIGYDRELIDLLKQTLDDEEKTDKKLTDVCKRNLFPAAQREADAMEDEEEDEEATTR